MRINQSPYIIFSSELYDNHATVNEVLTEQTEAFLINEVGLNKYKRVLGSYKYITENGFMVPLALSNEPHSVFTMLKDYAESRGQESILVVHGDDYAELHYLKGENKGQTVGLGYMREVSPGDAARLGSWTKDLTTDTYYAVVGN